MFSKIYVEITNICNLSCSFCSKDNLPKREMSIEEFTMVIDKIKHYTKSIYLHVKGEPLLHRKLDEILDICDNNNIKVCITTNGTLLEKRKDLLLKHRIKQINVSLHSENNDKDYFSSVFNTSDILSKNTTIIYRIWTLASLDLNKTSTKIVDKIILHYKLDDKVICKIKKEKNIEIKNNIYLDKNFAFEWPKINNENSNKGTCLGTISHIGILSNGDVVPCCLDSSGIINLGNIFRDNMNEILNSELFIKIKKGFQEKKIVMPLCQSCTYRKRFDK